MDSQFNIQDSKQAHAPLYGLVLVGGRSSRMGTDKAAMRYHGKMQSEHCLHLLSAFCEKSFLAARKEQADEPAFKDLPQIHDQFEQACPLNGILSAMEAHPSCAWLVLGCDLPFVDERVISILARSRDLTCSATAFRHRGDGMPEPMCAIYEPSISVVLKKLMHDGSRSPREALLDEDVCLIDPPGPDDLININSVEERQNALNKNRKKVLVRYFALLREERGCTSEDVETMAQSPSELFRELRARHGLSLAESSLRVAVNDEFGDWNTALANRDSVAFIPPVAGG